MNPRKKIIYFFLALAVLAGLFYHAEIQSLWLSSKEKLADISKNGLIEKIQNIETTVSAPPPLRSDKEAPNPTLTQAGTIKWTNINRQNNGLPALRENSKLDEAAMNKAKDIFDKQYFEHISPTGKGPQDLAADVGYDYIAIGENLALGNFANDQELLDGWMNSPGHRENILRKGYKELGVAVLKGQYEGKSTWVAVQEFGTPLSDCAPVDSNLKKTIDSDTAGLNDLENTLKTKKDEISSLRKSDPSLPGKIDEYNSLVKQYNALAGKIKSEIDAYNSQVAGFNSCIKKYQ